MRACTLRAERSAAGRACGAALLVLLGAAGARGQQPRVVLVSLDGLRPDALSEQTAPNITRLLAAGTRAAAAWDDLPAATLPNHATMLTGLVARQHGVLLDIELPGYIRARTLFDYASQAGLRCAFLASKAKLRYLAPPDALETILIEPDEVSLAGQVVALLGPRGPDLIFAHFRDPDSTGHRGGWMSPAYLAAVSLVDALVGQIAAAIEADSSRSTFLILTADHGGEGLGHVLNTPAVRRIPWIVVGPDVPAGGVLEQVVTIADTTPTILWLLGIEVPAGLAGTVQSAVRRDGSQGRPFLPPVPPVGLPCLILCLPAFCLAGLLVRQAGRSSALRC